MNYLDDSVTRIVGLAMLAINFTTMLVIFPAKRNLLFTICVFSIAAIILRSINMNPVLRGFGYLPVMVLLFKGYFFHKVFAFFLQYLLTLFQVILAAMLSKIFADYGASAKLVIFTAALIAMFAIYVAFILKFGRNFFNKLFIHSSHTEWVAYSFGIAFAFAILVAPHIVSSNILNLILTHFFVLWSFGILCYAVINAHEKSRQKYEAEFARSVVSAGQEHHQKMKEMYEALNILRHDYKYHIRVINEMVNSGDTNGVRQYLTDIQEMVPEDNLHNYCSNSVFNALLSSYAEHCARHKIEYSIQLALPETLSIPNYEMCIILGNLLENAVEACQKLESNRKIELAVKTQGAHIAVMVKNSFNGVINKENGQMTSAKKDGGFGLRSVQAIIARYNGRILTEWDNGIFTAYVMI